MTTRQKMARSKKVSNRPKKTSGHPRAIKTSLMATAAATATGIAAMIQRRRRQSHLSQHNSAEVSGS